MIHINKRGLFRRQCTISIHLSSTSPRGKLLCLFRGGGGSRKVCHEFPFLGDVELVERSLRGGGVLHILRILRN